MLSPFLRRRRRTTSLTLLCLLGCACLFLWNYSSVDQYKHDLSYNKLGMFFRGLLEQKVPADFYRLPADDAGLVNIIRTKLIRPPSDQEYNLTTETYDDFTTVQSKAIDNILGGKENGFFVECGVYDGEYESVTVYLEKTRHWRGLLIEPNKEHYRKLLNKHRKSHSINACVRTDLEHYYTPEKSSDRYGYFVGKYDDKSVPCFWLTTLLLATGEEVIDLLTVDLHGQELTLLESIDFQKINLKTIKLEIPMSYNATTLRTIMDAMRTKGYIGLHQFTNHIRHKKDIVFGKET